MEIRQATTADVTEVRRLQMNWAAEQVTRGYAPDEAAQLATRTGGCFFVATLGGATIGFLLGAVRCDARSSAVIPPGDRYVEIDDLYVVPTQRSSGVGRRLIEAAAAWARREGVAFMLAYSATRDLDRVLRFYRSAGFEGWAVQVYRDLRTEPGQV